MTRAASTAAAACARSYAEHLVLVELRDRDLAVVVGEFGQAPGAAVDDLRRRARPRPRRLSSSDMPRRLLSGRVGPVVGGDGAVGRRRRRQGVVVGAQVVGGEVLAGVAVVGRRRPSRSVTGVGRLARTGGRSRRRAAVARPGPSCRCRPDRSRCGTSWRASGSAWRWMSQRASSSANARGREVFGALGVKCTPSPIRTADVVAVGVLEHLACSRRRRRRRSGTRRRTRRRVRGVPASSRMTPRLTSTAPSSRSSRAHRRAPIHEHRAGSSRAARRSHRRGDLRAVVGFPDRGCRRRRGRRS